MNEVGRNKLDQASSEDRVFPASLKAYRKHLFLLTRKQVYSGLQSNLALM